MALHQRTGGGAGEDGGQEPERQRQVAGAKHKCTSHPHHSLDIRWCVQRIYFRRITTTAPITSKTTTARHIRIRLMVLSPEVRIHNRPLLGRPEGRPLPNL